MSEKCDDDIRVKMSSELKNVLFRLAEQDGRTLSDYVRNLLTLHAYGHAAARLRAAQSAPGEHGGT